MESRRARLVIFARAAAATVALTAVCARAPEARAAEDAAVADLVAAPTVAFDSWRGLSFGSYLAPKDGFVGADGGVDVIFHFHGGQMAAPQLKDSGMNAVFVSCGFGIGSGAYSAKFASPQRFGQMMDEVLKSLAASTGRRDLHVRKLALSSWSAGFAAVGKILSVDRYYAMVDAVVLNDSLHGLYMDSPARASGGTGSARGADHVDLKTIRTFVRFAADAVAGRETMVITHSAIVPPDYASSTEATQALLVAIDVPATDLSNAPAVEPCWRGMPLVRRADAGNLHVRGFRGAGPRDHFQHLHLIGVGLRAWVAPRWKQEDRLVYTLPSEPR